MFMFQRANLCVEYPTSVLAQILKRSERKPVPVSPASKVVFIVLPCSCSSRSNKATPCFPHAHLSTSYDVIHFVATFGSATANFFC